MPGKALFCPQLLSPQGWKYGVLMRIDRQGVIDVIEEGEATSAQAVLEGPVLPGMPNCHSHAFQRQMAGLTGTAGPAGSDSFWTWREAMYRLANRLSPDQLYAIARWLYVEMLEAGYTSCAEFHYLHHAPGGEPYAEIDEMSRALLRAAEDAGLALTLLPVLYCRSGIGADGVAPRQSRFYNAPARFLSLWEHCLDRVSDHPHHVLGLGLHSLRAVAADEIDTVLEAAGGRAAAIHIHVAEQPAEVEQCLAALGARPVQWLLDHHAVDRRWCLVHATHMNDAEREAAASSGAVAGLCPTTEADLGDGFFEAAPWMDAGGGIAIGSDSHLRVSPREELRLLEFGVRLRTGRRNVLARRGLSCGRTLYETAARGGARALGQAIGELAAGRRADFVELDHGHPLLRGLQGDEILDRYVFAGEKDMIRSVYVAGRQLVGDGAHAGRDDAAAGFAGVMEALAQ